MSTGLLWRFVWDLLRDYGGLLCCVFCSGEVSLSDQVVYFFNRQFLLGLGKGVSRLSGARDEGGNRGVGVRGACRGKILATMVGKRLSRRATKRMERTLSARVRRGTVGQLIVSFGKIAFVSDSKVNVVIKQCGGLRTVKKRAFVVGLSPRISGVLRVSKVGNIVGYGERKRCGRWLCRTKSAYGGRR